MIKILVMIALRAVVAFIGVFIVLILITAGLGRAFGQSVPTHEAELSEIDRSYNYDAQKHGIVPDRSTYRDYNAATDLFNIASAPDILACDLMNRDLYAKVQMIAKRIAAKPHLGYIYVGALNTIHSMWCTSYD